MVGYAGGAKPNPTYHSIKDYTEAIRVEYNPNTIKYADVLQKFLEQLGGGPTSKGWSRQYRSAVLVHNPFQRETAENFLKVLSIMFILFLVGNFFSLIYLPTFCLINVYLFPMIGKSILGCRRKARQENLH